MNVNMKSEVETLAFQPCPLLSYWTSINVNSWRRAIQKLANSMKLMN